MKRPEQEEWEEAPFTDGQAVHDLQERIILKLRAALLALGLTTAQVEAIAYDRERKV